MKNLLNNLLNWVLKKGPSETKKDQAWEEKEQAGSKKEQAEQKGNKLGEKEQVKRTKLEMNPCVRGSEAREVMGSEAREVMGSEAVSANHALITQLSRTNHPISLRAIRYAAVLFMVLMVGVGQAWADETVFSATVIATENVSVSKQTTDQAITSGQATISGGSMYVSNGQEKNDKTLISTSMGPSGDKRKGFTMTNSNTMFKVVLSSALQNGDEISTVFYPNSGSDGNGLWFSTGSTIPGSAPTAKATTSSVSAWTDISYTVSTGDGICGETAFYIYRATSTSTTFQNFTITRASTTKYTLAYDANGGSGSMPAHEFASGTTVYAGQNAGFTPPTGKIFKCWNTEAEGGGTEYKEGDSFTLSANTTLYAQWITASTGSTYCINMYDLSGGASDQMKYFTYSGYDDMQILDLEVPNYKTGTNNFWVGKNGSWYNDNLGNSNAKSANERLQDLCLKGKRSTKLGTSSQGVLARFFVYDNSWQNNLYIEFTPKQYSLIWGEEGKDWTPVKLYPSGCENEWTSEVVSLTSDHISNDDWKYYVGILKADNGVASWYKSNTKIVSSMGTYNKPSDSWGGNVSTLSAGDKGFFRMWSDATSYDNWRCHFVPVYTLSYNANSGTGAPANAYTATEGDATARTLKVSTTEPTRNGYSFEGWAESSANASAGTVDYAPGASITLSADQELWAVWECVDPTIGTDLSESQVDKYVGDASPTLTVAATAAGGSVSYQWYSNTAKSTTSPTPTALTTGASYSPSTAAAGTTYYFCKITNSTAGCSNVEYSKIAKIVVSRANPTQYTVSGTASICAGGNTDITLSGSQVGASYQLKIGGSATGDPKEGTGNALTWNVSATGTYTVSAVQTTKYSARDMNGSATVSSKTPTSVSFSDYTLDATEGESFEITGISAAGSGTLTYQWYSYTDAEGSGEDDIDGATSSTYTFTPASTGDYYFKCKVTGDCGSVKSDMITVTAATACSTPADPGGLTAGSISSSGVTFTITDDANTNNYEIYYSTSSTAPTGSTDASATTTSKSKAVTGLTANTTYYAWVRAVCNDDYKSDWVALTGSTFKTLAAGTKYYLFTPTSAPNPSHTGTLSGVFISPAATSASKTIDTYTFTKNITFGGTISSISGQQAGDKNITYYNKTSSTKFTLYVDNTNGSQQILYISKIVEGETSVTVANCTIPASTAKSVEYTYETTDNTTFGFSVGNSQLVIYQIVAEEAGTAHKVAGENGYALNLNKGRVSCPLTSKADISVNGFLIKAPYNNYKFTNTTELQIDKDKESSSYIKFTTPASPGRLKLTYGGSSGVQMAYNTSASDDGATSITSGTSYTLSGSTTYYLVNTGTQTAKITKIEFTAPVSTYNVSAVTSTGTSTYGTVSAAASTLAKDATTTITAVPTTGYKVTNWAVSGTGASISPSGASNSTTTTLTMGTADATVTVTFGVESYTLTWNANGGSDGACTGSCTSGSTAYNTTLVAPSDPTLSNYTFDGWNTANDGSGSAAAATMPASDVTYYAAWKQTVTLTTGAQGEGGNQTPYVYLNGTGVSNFTAHTASGYTLQGYYTAGSGGVKVLNADGTFASANVDGYITSSKWSRTGAAPTLYAQWVAASDCHTLKYAWKASGKYCDDGTTSVEDTVRFPANASNLYFTVSGTGNTVSKGSSYNIGKTQNNYFLLTAKSGYEIKSICFYGKIEDSSVNYTTDGSSWSSLSSTSTSSDNYYSFNNINASAFGIKLTAASPAGVWIRNMVIEVCASDDVTYNVTYNGNDETSGSAPTDATNYNYGGTVTVQDNGTLAKTNYTFAGWTTNNDGTGSSYVEDNTFSITANTTLYAKWTQAVTFNANTANHGSTGGSATAVWNATGLTGITHATPVSGYKLTGYYTDATEGTKVLNSDGTFASTAVTGYITDGKWTQATSSSPTLYAQYESAGSLIWNLSVNTDATSLTTSSKSSSFTEISTSNMSNAALNNLTYSGDKKSNLTGKISTPSSYTSSDYVYVTFQVASGYKFTPSSVKVKAQPVTSAKSVKLILEDEKSHSINFTTASTISGGSTQTVEMTNGSSVYFEGTVTLKIYCYGATDAYRLGTPITIEGAVEEACATMPSYTSMSYTTTSFLPSADASGSPITIVGGDNINTYQWKYNTVNDRTSGTNCGTNNASLTPLTDDGAATDVTRYYWCEMTNNACGITIKSPAVAITVAAAKSDATVTWTNPASTPNYGGGGYTIKATVDQTGWDGNAADLVITAPAGIRIYNVSSGTTSNQKWVQADFDVQTAFDRTTYASTIPFTVSAAATASYNAISDDHNVSYSACTGGATSEELMPVNVDSVNSTVKGWRFIGKGKMWFGHGSSTPGTSSSNIKSLDNTMADGAINKYYNSGGSYYSFYTEKAITGVRLYVYTSNSNVKVSNVYIANSQFSTGTPSSGAVSYSVVYNDDNEGLDKGDNYYSAWAEITFASEVAAGKYGLIKLDNNVRIAGIGLLSNSGSGASLNTHLQWSGGLADGDIISKSTNDAYFTYSASKITENMNTLGAITYSSSAPSVATVDATGKVTLVAAGSTTIKATLAASGCYKKAEISYTLKVTEVACAITAGTLTLTSGTESKCSSADVTLTLTGFESGAAIQWKDGDTNIDNGDNYTIATDGTTSTLTTNQEGTYSVMVTSGCSVRSNRITIKNASAEASVSKIIDEWYIKQGRLTPDIALFNAEGATSFTIKDASTDAEVTSIAGCTFELQDDVIYLHGYSTAGVGPTGIESAANETIKVVVTDACGNEASVGNIIIHKQIRTDKHVLAFVVGNTKKKNDKYVAIGKGFTDSIPSSQTTDVPLYNTITANFDVLATNIYSTDNEKKLKEYYSQFDIICITDYPNTQTKGENKKSYVDAIGSLVDIRPILTMEAFVSKLDNWKAKGISGNPSSPTTRQYTMLLQCKDHEIFAGTELTKVREGEDEMYRVSMVDNTLEDYVTLDATYGGGEHAEKSGYEYGSKPALQGFTFNATMAADGLLPLGLIDDGAGNDLQVGIERQAKMEARLMVLGINGYAMERLTDDGQTVVVNALKYLMKKNSEDIADCSNTFVGGAEGDETNWHNATNWSGNTVPDKTQKVRIVAPCVIMNGKKARVAGVIIAPNGKYNHGSDSATGSLTISAGAALIVDGKVEAATAPYFTKTRTTSSSNLAIGASSTAQGALIFDNEEGETNATVEMYSASYWETVAGKKKKYWSYVALPIQSGTVGEYFYNGFSYLYDETKGWIKKGMYTELHAFEGLGISMQSGHMEYFHGPLAPTTTQEFTLTKTPAAGNGENLIGNSWTAPIQIANFDASDFGEATATVYVYNTGRDEQASGSQGTSSYGGTGSETAGQWVSVPISTAKEGGYTGLKVIPAMNAFQVNTSSETTLTLDYDKLVRGGATSAAVGDLTTPLRAPKRSPAKAQNGIEAMMCVRMSGEKTHADVWLQQDERFSEAFDNGWEATYVECDNRSPQFYAQSEIGKMAFLALPDLEGTVLGLAPSRDGNEYSFTFHYVGEEEFYLNDLKLRDAVLINEENSYEFTYEEGDTNRFYISSTPINAPEIATGVDNTRDGIKAQKILYNDKLYIIVNGRVYSATGGVVR